MKLEKQVTSLSCQVQKAQSNGFVPSRGPSKRKSSSEYSDCHRRGLKKKRKEKCHNSLAWLQSEGYSTKVILVNTTTGQEESIDLNTDCLLAADESHITDVEMDTINMMLYIKDRYNISGGAYHEMTQICKEMPRHYYKLKERINELNKIWDIQPTPNGKCGVQQLFKERLQLCLHSLVRFFVCACVYYLFTQAFLHYRLVNQNLMQNL